MHIKTIHSETDLWYNFVENFRQTRQVSHLSLYLDDGIEKYYQAIDPAKAPHTQGLNDYYLDFFLKNMSKNRKYTIVSLGCGDARREKNMLKELIKQGYNISYYGIDVSLNALEMAIKNLKLLKIPQQYICADFTRDNFLSEIREILSDDEIAIFSLFGGNMSNIENAEFVGDIMTDMLRNNDYIWVDVAIRTNDSENENRKLFERYRTYAQSKARQIFYFHSLAKIGLPFNKGTIGLQMQKEDSVGAICFRFIFRPQIKIKINYRGHNITLMPQETIRLSTIRVYSADKLIDFFTHREFQAIDQDIEGGRGQFLFQKTNS